MINVVSLRGEDVDGVQADVGIGTHGHRLVRARAGHRFGGGPGAGPVDVLVAGSGRVNVGPALSFSGTPVRFANTPPVGWTHTERADVSRDNREDRFLELLFKVRATDVGLSFGVRDYTDFGQLSSFSHAVLSRDDNEERSGREVWARLYTDLSWRRFDLHASAFFRLSLTRNLAHNATFGVLSGSREPLEELLLNLRLEAGVERVEVLDRDGTVLAEAGEGRAAQPGRRTVEAPVTVDAARERQVDDDFGIEE